MIALYVDNYRGFKETYIPIKEVNFLVGENSTGKTSILAIVYLITNHYFWMEQQFNNDTVQLGTFNDIISMGSQNTSDFRVGVVYAAEEDTGTFAFLARFAQREGLPYITHFDFYRGGVVVNMVLGEDSVKYKTEGRKLGPNEEGSLRGLLDEWQRGGKSRKGFKTLDLGKVGVPMQHALMYATQMVEQHIKTPRKEYTPPLYFSMVNLFSKLTWFAPIRSKPKRTYDDYRTDFAPDGSHTPYLIRKLLGSSKIAEKFRDFIREFGKNSGLLDAIGIRQFRKTDIISPFELSIELDGKQLNIKNVGYGVSQALPVVVEIYEGDRGGWFAIQQPEIHMHPRAQAALGDLVYRFANKDKKKFLIETHSDYAIDRFRSNYGQDMRRGGKPDAQVLFFKRTRRGNEVEAIQINSSGEYSREQPKEFRDFFISEQLNTLGIRP